MIRPREWDLLNPAAPMWLLRKLYLWTRSWVELKSRDVILACYPKTGSTWVRIFLYNLLAEKREYNATFSFDDVDSTMPEFANENFFKDWPFSEYPRLVKTHHDYMRIFRQNPAVLLIRDPRDVMISYYYYARSKRTLPFSGTLHDLVQHPGMGLEPYMTFYQSWYDNAELIIRYEDMKESPQEEFTRLCHFMDVDATSDEIKLALNRSTLEETRRAQERSSQEFQEKFVDDFTFARRGTTGEGRQQFDKQLNEYYRQLRREYDFHAYDQP